MIQLGAAGPLSPVSIWTTSRMPNGLKLRFAMRSLFAVVGRLRFDAIGLNALGT